MISRKEVLMRQFSSDKDSRKTSTGDETTILDSSTIPTYEEFTCKSKGQKKQPAAPALAKPRFLNSTQYSERSAIFTDDESSDSDSEPKNCSSSSDDDETPRATSKSRTLLKTPIRVTERLCGQMKTLAMSPLVDDYVHMEHKECQTSFEMVRDAPQIVTTYESRTLKEGKILLISHQMMPRKKKRVSMCVEDVPADVAEKNWDHDENRLDVTSGKIFSLQPLQEQRESEEIESDGVVNDTVDEDEVDDAPKSTKQVEKAKKYASSDSESNDEAFERFLQTYKESQKPQKPSLKELKGFIATSSDENKVENDDDLFYLKTTNLIRKKEAAKPKSRMKIDESAFVTARTPSVFTVNSTTSSSSSSDRSIEQISPQKAPSKENKRPLVRKNSESALETVFKTPLKTRVMNECKTERKAVVPIARHVTHKYGFVESLSGEMCDEMRDPDAVQFMKKFKMKSAKDELLKKVFLIFNESIFDGKLPGDMKLTWNNRLTSTAGLCKYKMDGGRPVAEIHISNKVCDTPDRLRDTCVHEMCHSAVYLLNGLKNEGHGRMWQYWAIKVSERYKSIPKVTTSHNYTVNKKFTYRCQDCGQEIHRFQKSIDLDNNLCGRCHGKFSLINNNDKQKESKPTCGDAQFHTPRKLNSFAQFVKDKYGSVKSDKKLTQHREVMQEISKQFKLLAAK